MEAKISYYGHDGGSEDGSLSLDEDEHYGENYMSLHESYSGNVSGLHVLNHIKYKHLWWQ